ncbi:MAG: hypothetical protein HFJ34_06085 [Clostridia bacterium]|nr:hypothetical protein [Clostridia bacterium]
MKKDKQIQINKRFKSIPNKYYHEEDMIVEIDEGIFFGEVQNVIKFFEKIMKIYEVDKNYEQIKQLDYQELSGEEYGFKDKIELIEELNNKVANRQLKEKDVVCIEAGYMGDYTYLKSKRETLKMLKRIMAVMETEL